MSDSIRKPPRDGFRAYTPGIELRAADQGSGAGPVMRGHFSVFDQKTEINSLYEGNFIESVASGAYKKTFREQRASMRVLLNHGQDPQLGDKPLGPIRELREDDTGAYYEVSLLDAPYVRDNVLPGLEAGLYGASFRFRVVREDWNDHPDASDYNPRGLPERTIREAQVSEFGPVTFPAYEGATAGIRSLTDDFIMRAFAQDPERLRAMFDQAHNLDDRPVQVAVPKDVATDDEKLREEHAGLQSVTLHPPVEERVDTEDIDVIAQMLSLASGFIDEQDEPADQAALDTMKTVVSTLTGLLPSEVAEDEPAETDADDMGGRAAPQDDLTRVEQDPAPSDGDAGPDAHLADAERRDTPNTGDHDHRRSHLLERAGRQRPGAPWHRKERSPWATT